MSEQFVLWGTRSFRFVSESTSVTKKLFVSQDRMDKRVQDLLDKASQAKIIIEKLSAQQ